MTDVDAPTEQLKAKPVFTEDHEHELKRKNVNLQRAKLRLRNANAALQELFLELAAMSAKMEALHRSVETAREGVARASQKPLKTAESKKNSRQVPEGWSMEDNVDDDLREPDDPGTSGATSLSHEAKLARSQEYLRRVTSEHREATQALAELQLRLSCVNLEVQQANDELHRAFRDMRQAERYEFMLAHQDQFEIRGAFVAITGQQPCHWEALDTTEQEKREKAAEAERLALEAEHAGCCPRDEIHSMRRHHHHQVVAPAPVAIPVLSLPLLPKRGRGAVAGGGAVTDRPRQTESLLVGGGLTPRIVCRGGMSGVAVVCRVAGNRDAPLRPAPAQLPPKVDLRLPSIPQAKHHVHAGLAHQPLPKGLLS